MIDHRNRSGRAGRGWNFGQIQGSADTTGRQGQKADQCGREQNESHVGSHD